MMRNKVTYRNWVFKDPKIAFGTVSLEQSLPLTELGIDTFEAEVKCRDKSILDFEQNEPVHYFHRKQQVGIYYVQAIERVSPDHYAISSISTLGLLEQMNFYGGIYTGQTVQEVVAAICGNIPVIVKTNLQEIKLYGWIGICSARQALQQVLFAIGANLSTDHDGVLRIENLWDGISAVIPADQIYLDGNSVKQGAPVTAVTVLEHQYVPGAERRDLYDGTTTQGQRIPFSDPADQLQAEGFSILESGANYAIVSAGSGKLTGCPYVHTTLEVTKTVTNAHIKNEERIENATLVSLVNSNAVAERMAAYYSCRKTISTDVVLRREQPGQVVSICHPYDKKMVQATIGTSSVNISSILKGSLTLLEDFTPPQTEAFQYFDERVVLTGTGEWEVPEGVDRAEAVIIGAGGGGSSGLPGGLPSSPALQTGSDPEWNLRYQRRPIGAGGDGGLPGSGGVPGKVLRVHLQLTPGQKISYRCGVGGVGGKAVYNADAENESSAAGESGEETTFGDYSSVDGTSSMEGYYDPVTQKVYAAQGEKGLPGGKGGGRDESGAWNDQIPGEDVICDGITYHGGPTHTDAYKTDKMVFAAQSTTISIVAGYGCGGGAAAGADGARSADEPHISKLDESTVEESEANAYGGAGGHGGNAVKPDDQEKIGWGGRGGNGGGGAGAGGAAGVESMRSGTPGTTPPWVKAARTSAFSSKQSRGAGSDGGKGGAGGIILYIRRLKPVQSGAFLSKDKSFLLDKHGRLLIV